MEADACVVSPVPALCVPSAPIVFRQDTAAAQRQPVTAAMDVEHMTSLSVGFLSFSSVGGWDGRTRGAGPAGHSSSRCNHSQYRPRVNASKRRWNLHARAKWPTAPRWETGTLRQCQAATVSPNQGMWSPGAATSASAASRL